MTDDESDINRHHAAKMAKKKAVRDKILADKTEERGLLIVHTGKGKGKTTAAMGMALRCIGHGMKVGIVQFVKGARATGERAVFARFPDLCVVEASGEGFTWETQDRARDMVLAAGAWQAAQAMMADSSFRMVILDEINIVLRYAYLDFDTVLAALKNRPQALHVVVTGRNAREELIEAADLVTEMALVKHPFRAGVKAQAGIEY
ncbi:Cob(I)yrinic acid a,c-diamide adenosyltransferase [Candidatus Defluviicoccus seviourii]|uniref:Corrinoid adenosyltransferase n=2 Tax=root TaxID=1 RepID=A0A564WE46_9PROT|nr:Cob(I)yrinic acid a,c-diamide adenosyltransferase [uncultured Defluviicoccus sp.]SUS07861.1 Cob(I)yrinic acid a,c-diamide adenosyltransferase [uncultured Defluviicoccus sp.]VUX45813.1 Cob(I)yrinic acid a,c-diamide adenosyltransferase [Candidatus Defluviicoccus seviourii]